MCIRDRPTAVPTSRIAAGRFASTREIRNEAVSSRITGTRSFRAFDASSERSVPRLDVYKRQVRHGFSRNSEGKW